MTCLLKGFKRFGRSCESFFYRDALIKTTFLYVQGLNELQVCSLANVACPQHGLLIAFAIPTLNTVPVATTSSPSQQELEAFMFTLSFWVRAATPLA